MAIPAYIYADVIAPDDETALLFAAQAQDAWENEDDPVARDCKPRGRVTGVAVWVNPDAGTITIENEEDAYRTFECQPGATSVGPRGEPLVVGKWYVAAARDDEVVAGPFNAEAQAVAEIAALEAVGGAEFRPR
ncbi:MAG TPA: hypothetical protein VFS20_18230 [Longimicrobium sp.]|nr:hypothetical protein [Longimicrobium sp.]